MPNSQSVTILTSKYDRALTMVRNLQNGEARKGGGSVPYLAHSIGVSALVLEYGGTEDQAIAGLLHDVAEDNGGERMLSVIEEEFDPTIADYVRDLSDSLVEDPENKKSWYPRKTEYMDAYEKKSGEVLLISAADKLHNVRAMVTDHKSLGQQLWLRFDKKVDAPAEFKRTQQLWYLNSLSKILTAKLENVQPYGSQIARDFHDELTTLELSVCQTEHVSIEELRSQIENFTGELNT